EGLPNDQHDPDQTVVLHIWDVATGKLLESRGRFPQYFKTLAFAEDGRLVAGDDLNGNIILFDTMRQRVIRVVRGRRVVFAPDARTFAVTSLFLDWNRNFTIKVYETASGDERRRFTGPKGDVASIAFSPDGRMLASGMFDS